MTTCNLSIIDEPDFLADFSQMAIACAVLSFMYLIVFVATGRPTFQFVSVAGGGVGVICAFLAAWESRKE